MDDHFKSESGTQLVADTIAAAEPYDDTATPAPDLQAELERLSALPEPDYQRERLRAAKNLGVQVGFLDQQRKQRLKGHRGVNKQGSALVLDNPERWHEPVDGAALLDEIVYNIRIYVHLSHDQAVGVALWCVSTWTGDKSSFAPRLGITSPVKRCGKTTLLDLVAAFSSRSLKTSSATGAAVARVVEAQSPTLIIDEADSFLPNNEDLRGILNAGHRRDGQVIKCVGDDYEVRFFKVFCWAAIAAIGTLPATIADRSINLRMERAGPDSKPHRLTAKPIDECRKLGAKIRRFVEDNIDALTDANPTLPQGLNYRAQDNWCTMIAVANAAGGDWPARAARAALHLSADIGDRSEGDDVAILNELRSIFEYTGVERLSSEEACKGLAANEEGPWREWSGGKPITPAQLARQLKHFGITPQTIRIGKGTIKGYMRDAFANAFKRYLPPIAPPTGAEPSHRNIGQETAKNQHECAVTHPETVTGQGAGKSAENEQCYGVTPADPDTGGLSVDQVTATEETGWRGRI
jgi:putative DNA primase/helicase